MQSSLNDLSTRRDTPSFIICQRVLLKVQHIIFADPPAPSSSPYQGSKLSSTQRFWKRKIRPRLRPTLMGITAILAGAPGMPALTPITGNIAIEQGRIEENTTKTRPHLILPEDEVTAPIRDTVEPVPAEGPNVLVEDSDDDEEEDLEDFGRASMSSKPPLIPPDALQLFTKSVSSLRTPSLSRRTTLGGARTSPALNDDLPQLSRNNSHRSQTQPAPYHSSPSVSATPPRSIELSPDALLDRYSHQSQSLLLRSHYCRSEVKFLLTLESIANRLLVIPKLAVSLLPRDFTQIYDLTNPRELVVSAQN